MDKETLTLYRAAHALVYAVDWRRTRVGYEVVPHLLSDPVTGQSHPLVPYSVNRLLCDVRRALGNFGHEDPYL